ncbi:MAG: TIGR03960 family B12-binding radical SAM protein [Planctomycetota bacterium]
MNNLRDKVTSEILPFVEKPGRCIGGEWNTVAKQDAAVRFLLAFPDTYEIGMSHLGYQILYDISNKRPDVAAERAYAPLPDMEKLMREKGVPLYGLETFTPAREFDIVGFSLQYEMCFTNVLNMLDLAGIPVHAAERTGDDPLIVAGGPCAFSPEPMADFIDIFVLGDGEDIVLPLVDTYQEVCAKTDLSRKEKIAEIVRRVPALYAPALYEVSYNEDGTVSRVAPTVEGIPEVVRAAYVENLDAASFPEKPIVPFVETVHDRINVEIMRGCTHGCRFCQAGMMKRPVRTRSGDEILRLARSCYASTGHREMSLASLSTSDYPGLRDVLLKITRDFEPKKVSVSVPSLRVGEQLSMLPEILSTVRKSGLTIALEAARPELRAIINKDIQDKELFEGVTEAYRQGWNLVKLYFMVGLPGETDEDIDAIVDMAYRVSNLRREIGKGPANVNVAVAPFVPKAHTPFQWEPMAAPERLDEIRERLYSKLRSRRIHLSVHKTERSFLEGVFARGDRKLGQVILAAWRKGCKFDSWDEHFHSEAWHESFQECGIAPAFYANRKRNLDEVLPWSNISTGVTLAYLKKERERAFTHQMTPDCRLAGCHGCGPFPCRKD